MANGSGNLDLLFCLPSFIFVIIVAAMVVFFLLFLRGSGTKGKGKAGTDADYFKERFDGLLKAHSSALAAVLPSLQSTNLSLGKWVKGIDFLEAELLFSDNLSSIDTNSKGIGFLAAEAGMLEKALKNVTLLFKSSDMDIKLLAKNYIGEVYDGDKLVGTVDIANGDVKDKNGKSIANFEFPMFVARGAALGGIPLPVPQPKLDIKFNDGSIYSINLSTGAGPLFLGKLPEDKEQKILLLSIAIPFRCLYFFETHHHTSHRHHSHFHH